MQFAQASAANSTAFPILEDFVRSTSEAIDHSPAQRFQRAARPAAHRSSTASPIFAQTWSQTYQTLSRERTQS
jgi:hypothetical protein